MLVLFFFRFTGWMPVQKFSSGTGSPGWSQKKCSKTVVVVYRLDALPVTQLAVCQCTEATHSCDSSQLVKITPASSFLDIPTDCWWNWCCSFTQALWSLSAVSRVAFSALTVLVGWQEGHPACKNGVVRYWHGYLPGARCKWFAYGPADATAIPSSLAPVKSRMVCLSGAGLPRLSWKKGR